MTGNLISAAVSGAADIPAWFVVCMGLGTVFVGLIFIFIICKIIGLFFKGGSEETKPANKALKADLSDEERGKVIAAVCAAAAEDMGTDISALRVVSFKKI